MFSLTQTRSLRQSHRRNGPRQIDRETRFRLRGTRHHCWNRWLRRVDRCISDLTHQWRSTWALLRMIRKFLLFARVLVLYKRGLAAIWKPKMLLLIFLLHHNKKYWEILNKYFYLFIYTLLVHTLHITASLWDWLLFFDDNFRMFSVVYSLGFYKLIATKRTVLN